MDNCLICNKQTEQCCSDCAINSGGEKEVHICNNFTCMDIHEKLHEQVDKLYNTNISVN